MNRTPHCPPNDIGGAHPNDILRLLCLDSTHVSATTLGIITIVHFLSFPHHLPATPQDPLYQPLFLPFPKHVCNAISLFFTTSNH
jgi:hypothetical protein